MPRLDSASSQTQRFCSPQEITKKELETKKQQVAQLESEVKELNARADKLQGLYKKQDDILGESRSTRHGRPLPL